MDQNCLGMPRTLASAILIDVDLQEELEDAVIAKQHAKEVVRTGEEASKNNIDEMNDDQARLSEAPVDQYDQHEDFRNEYLIVSNSKRRSLQ